MKLSVIIVSYNVKHYLTQCLRSVFASASGIRTEVFVVDNASADGTVEHLRAAFPAASHPQLHIVESPDNLGFGKANNQALAQATGDYVLFLNPDTLLTEHTLRDCLTFADSHPDLGALGVQMLKDNGEFALESRRGLPTPWAAFCKTTGLTALFPRSRRFGRYYLRFLDETQPAPIDIVSGAFMMVPRSVLRQTGGFDEQFFMYGEDIDLSYRLLKAGWQNYYLPTPILHYKGESTQKGSLRHVRVFHEAMLIFYRKHYPRSSFWLGLPVRAAVLLRAAVTLVHQRINRFRSAGSKGIGGRSLYIGTHTDAARAFALRHGIGMDFSTTTPTPAGAAPYLYYTYDTADHSYGSILHSLAQSDHRHYLGLFHPELPQLVTGGDVVGP